MTNDLVKRAKEACGHDGGPELIDLICDLVDRIEAMTADNARLRGACEGAVNWLDALAEQINATSCDPDDPEAFDEVLMGAGMFIANARAALTGKEPSHD